MFFARSPRCWPLLSSLQKNSNGSSLKERPKPSSVDQPLAPVSAPSPASSPNDGASNAASLKGKTAARDGTTAKNQAAVQKLLVGITWENVKACSIRERVSICVVPARVRRELTLFLPTLNYSRITRRSCSYASACVFACL